MFDAMCLYIHHVFGGSILVFIVETQRHFLMFLHRLTHIHLGIASRHVRSNEAGCHITHRNPASQRSRFMCVCHLLVSPDSVRTATCSAATTIRSS